MYVTFLFLCFGGLYLCVLWRWVLYFFCFKALYSDCQCSRGWILFLWKTKHPKKGESNLFIYLVKEQGIFCTWFPLIFDLSLLEICCIGFEYFEPPLVVLKKSSNPRWQMWEYDVIIPTLYDIIISFYGPLRQRFWSDYIHYPSVTVIASMFLKLWGWEDGGNKAKYRVKHKWLIMIVCTGYRSPPLC